MICTETPENGGMGRPLALLPFQKGGSGGGGVFS